MADLANTSLRLSSTVNRKKIWKSKILAQVNTSLIKCHVTAIQIGIVTLWEAFK